MRAYSKFDIAFSSESGHLPINKEVYISDLNIKFTQSGINKDYKFVTHLVCGKSQNELLVFKYFGT